MKYVIITGTSRGLGRALAYEFLRKDVHLFCISRSRDSELLGEAIKRGARLECLEFDFLDIENIEELMYGIFSKIDRNDAKAIYLINNAAVLEPIRPLWKCSATEISENISINLTAPMAMTSSFIRNSNNYNVEKRIVNISSGAAEDPLHGACPYCVGKAGIEMLTRCVAVEEKGKEHPVKILSFMPGIMDTDMQSRIRSSTEEDFAQIRQFKKYKEKGRLLAPSLVAREIARLLEAEKFKQGSCVDVYELIEQI